MRFVADFHIHSHYSRATSQDLNLESLYQWARIKGIQVIGTGDFTHPGWRAELEAKLEPDGTGLFRLKDTPPEPAIPGIRTTASEVRFCLSAEISSIYKHGDKVRKNHNLVFVPDFATARQFSARLGEIGNLASDGRPILGLPSRDLLEIVLETSPQAHLIPAHVWTPWFSTLGSKGGYDRVEDCFLDLTDHIFALETGLSSDPAMNWKLSALDKYTLVSNSDAHSPGKLGREANRFDTEQSYQAIFEALKTRQGFLGTYEFFPEEGKYHLDGHRKCSVCLEPQDTLVHNGLCPVCNKPLTIGVLNRVESLADRTNAQQPEGTPGFSYIIPLPEILGEILGTGPGSKSVQEAFVRTISSFGNEFDLLQATPLEDVRAKGGEVLAEAIRRLRAQQVHPQGGYDGEYGTISVFQPGELAALSGQTELLGDLNPRTARRKALKPRENAPSSARQEQLTEKPQLPKQELNAEQRRAVEADGCVLVAAGPGSGKTHTLVRWIRFQIETRNIQAQDILAITFTNKAAEELKSRLDRDMGRSAEGLMAGTFHSVAYRLLQELDPDAPQTIYDRNARLVAFRMLGAEDAKTLATLSAAYEARQERLADPSAEEDAFFAQYHRFLADNHAVDLSALVPEANRRLAAVPSQVLGHFQCVAVDEFQDISPVQYEFIRTLTRNKRLFAIGDPDQSIYGFRGADIQLWETMREAFHPHEVFLKDNYRTPPRILQAANALIAHNSGRTDRFARATGKSTAGVCVFAAKDAREEALYIAEQVLALVGGVDVLSTGFHHSDSEYAFSDIAVLCRTHAAAAEILRKLRDKGIPVTLNDGSSLWDSHPFPLVGAALEFLCNPKDSIALAGLVTGLIHQEFIPADMVKRICSHIEGTLALEEIAADVLWKEYTALHHRIRNEGLHLESALQAILAFLFRSISPTEEQEGKKETLLRLAKECGDDTAEFVRKQILSNGNSVGKLAGGVHLLSFHAAKGLEFPVVFLAAAEEGITPSAYKDSDPEEERRLFYVAMTRTQQELRISCAGKRHFHGTERIMAPSRFLQELDPSCTESIRWHAAGNPGGKPRQLELF